MSPQAVSLLREWSTHSTQQKGDDNFALTVGFSVAAE